VFLFFLAYILLAKNRSVIFRNPEQQQDYNNKYNPPTVITTEAGHSISSSLSG